MGDFPEAGTSAQELLDRLKEWRTGDLDWRNGRAFSLVYDVDEEEHEELLETVGRMFIHESALNPFKYRSLLQMEQDLIAYGRSLFGAGAAALSSGGTESIFLAVLTARDEGRERGITEPRLVCADTAHPAFVKACHYLGVERVVVPHGPDGRAVPEMMREAVDERTVLLVGSAPNYPFGVMDPIPEIAAIAAEAGTLCHVDACLGGWLLPWWERLGEPVPPWGFDVPGVTSMSADLHKYGYAFKGVSMILYRDRALLQRQIFMFDGWPGGIYASSSSAGTRPGAPIAGAWAAVTHLGSEGYLRLAERVRTATRGFRAGIESIEGLRITSDPVMSVFEFGSERHGDGTPVHDMDAIGDVMDDHGWNLDRQPGGLHLMLSPGHDRVVDRFCADLVEAAATAGASRGVAHTYGGVVGQS